MCNLVAEAACGVALALRLKWRYFTFKSFVMVLTMSSSLGAAKATVGS
jgi:hypothetical protein